MYSIEDLGCSVPFQSLMKLYMHKRVGTHLTFSKEVLLLLFSTKPLIFETFACIIRSESHRLEEILP